MVAGVIVVLATGVVVLSLVILSAAHSYGHLAQREFGGDEVQALMAVVDASHHSLADRNHAVWALGQLRDARALPVLQKHFTGGPCDHARYLCQREVKRAIEACGHRSASAPAWIAKVLHWSM